jgi:hypothetical protein
MKQTEKYVSGYRPVMGCFEDMNEHLETMNDWEFLDCLNDCQFLKRRWGGGFFPGVLHKGKDNIITALNVTSRHEGLWGRRGIDSQILNHCTV